MVQVYLSPLYLQKAILIPSIYLMRIICLQSFWNSITSIITNLLPDHLYTSVLLQIFNRAQAMLTERLKVLTIYHQKPKAECLLEGSYELIIKSHMSTSDIVFFHSSIYVKSISLCVCTCLSTFNTNLSDIRVLCKRFDTQIYSLR